MLLICAVVIVVVGGSLPSTAHAQYTPPPPPSPPLVSLPTHYPSYEYNGGYSPPPPPAPPSPSPFGDTVDEPLLSKDETVALAIGLAIGIPVLLFAAIGGICCLCSNTRCCRSGDNEDGREDAVTPATATIGSSQSHRRRHHNRHDHYTQYINTQFQVHEGICISFAPIGMVTTTSSSYSSYIIDIIEPRDEDVNNLDDAAIGSVLNTRRLHHNDDLSDIVDVEGQIPITIPTTTATAVQPNSNVNDDLASSQPRHNAAVGGDDAVISSSDDGEIVIYVDGGGRGSSTSSPSEVVGEKEGTSAFCIVNPYGVGSYEPVSPNTAVPQHQRTN